MIASVRAFRVFVFCIAAAPAAAQTRVAILQAEDHRAKTPGELATLRTGARSADPQIRRIAVRALGRLERPSLIPDILPSLRHALPEVRAEAANAVGQAAAGWKGPRSAAETRAFESAVASLTARLDAESAPEVRAALDETIGRMPYASATGAAAAERTLVDAAGRAESVGDRLGIAKGFEALVRQSLKLRQPGPEAIEVLAMYAAPAGAESAGGARIRRLAIEALSSAHAASDDLLAAAARDADVQVRRLAVREAVGPAAAPADRSERRAAIVAAALADPSPMVRLEAMRAADCEAASAAAADAED